MTATLTTVGSILTAFLGFMTEIVTWIAGTDLVMIYVGLAILLAAFAAVSRMIKGV